MRSLLAAGVLAVGLTALAPGIAHADENEDFLTCLSNNGLEPTQGHTGDLLALMGLVQNDLRHGFSAAQIESNLVIYHDVPYSMAIIDVKCVAAATVMGG